MDTAVTKASEIRPPRLRLRLHLRFGSVFDKFHGPVRLFTVIFLQCMLQNFVDMAFRFCVQYMLVVGILSKQ